MQQLIRLMAGEQGSPVVSARELHSFLQVKSKFADWFRNRVNQYEFVENQDYTALSKNLENGGRELDYGLTLDTAKELSMVERTPKGKEARQYFIEAEKQLHQRNESSDKALLLADHERRIRTLEQQIASLLESALPVANDESPLTGSNTAHLRAKVYQQVNDYAKASLTAHYMIWNDVYTRLQNLYGFNVRAHRKYAGETWLDVAERHGQMERIYAIVQAELNNSDDQ